MTIQNRRSRIVAMAPVSIRAQLNVTTVLNWTYVVN
jgi:hypothetical protein